MVHDAQNEEAFQAALETRLARLFEGHLQAAPTDEAKLLLGRLKTLVLRGGKRFRPRLLRQTYLAYGGQDEPWLIELGLALELHHQSLLVHDDIMDKDNVRYDGPNIMGYYQTDFIGNDTTLPADIALLAGNLLFSFACQQITDSVLLDDGQKVLVLGAIYDVNVGVHHGQLVDILRATKDPEEITKQELITMYGYKTALYSVHLPMRIAAELLGLPPRESASISMFAQTFGVLYQLVDDYSDYFQNDSAFDDHPKYRDFRQGNVTMPLLLGFPHVAKAQKAKLRKLLGSKQLAVETMQEIANVLVECGAQDEAKAMIVAYYKKALHGLDSLLISEESKMQFRALLNNCRV